VLFGGVTYSKGTLPRSYLPTLLSIQFTLTAIFTIISGFVLSIRRMIAHKLDWIKFLILTLWFFVPSGLVVIVEPVIYDNFRHFLFMIPPLFIFATIGIQSLFELVKKPALQVVLVGLLILPNVFFLVKLHPYQYVYYNVFTKGVGGAFRKYEMDYWGTSYREATMYINQIAPNNSRIIVYGAPHLVEIYARDDLNIEKYDKKIEVDHTTSGFAILLSRYDKDVQIFPEAERIYIVERDGAILAVIKELDFQ
jgi:hypothetical protein